MQPFDLFIIGGGINGCGIARDAAGRGLRVMLAEMNDFGGATSSASTKLFHGGLRYLEYFEFNLVRKALIEREVLLKAMPHISWPMRFVLPLHKGMRFDAETPTSRLLVRFMPWLRGRRPDWLIRLGLFLYDTLGGREILPGTAALDLRSDPAGKPLQDKFAKGFEYSDCWIEDSRLVLLNARDAEKRGATMRSRCAVTKAERVGDLWHISFKDSQSGTSETVQAKMLVNAGGPWVENIIHQTAGINSSEGVRLVRGSHIVTRKLFEHDKSYFFQGSDGRIIFAIPYEQDFTLIGTTDQDHSNPDTRPECSEEERDYLLGFASEYFAKPVTKEDVVWSYSGVRPLYDDGASSASAATRDYVLTVNQPDGTAPILNVFGGKITTYRKLAENALVDIAPFFPNLSGPWTAGVPLPGGDLAVADVEDRLAQLLRDYPFLTPRWALRLFRAYGTEAWDMLGTAQSAADLGRDFGATLSEQELRWSIANEYTKTAEDMIWRRSKLGLRLSQKEIAALEAFFDDFHSKPEKTSKRKAKQVALDP
ncbi:MAG: glycerol-3-phosphate dehydrogenase [Marinovum sp.]|nr:glycerol-3-phosphate dehydrogenase [Marinovum sp.]